jgi:ring-1,2-phenylacetyl-CoA epoxidase subunit PaaC
MTQSITIGKSPAMQYVLRLGDTCLILAQRLGEWTGHAPILEEDIALANMALDLLGQARALLTHAARLDGRQQDEDQLAFLRDERDFLNLAIVELPRGDFAFTVLRNLMVATWLKLVWERLAASGDEELAAIAGKAVKEARYHQQHAADWAVRLGDGTEESARRIDAALQTLWPYTAELFADDAVDEAAAAAGLGPKASALREPWAAEMAEVLAEARLQAPADTPFLSEAKRGRHTEHMGYILAEMQHLQRAYPGGTW